MHRGCPAQPRPQHLGEGAPERCLAGRGHLLRCLRTLATTTPAPGVCVCVCAWADGRRGVGGRPLPLEEPRSQLQPPWGLPGTAVSDSRGVSRGGRAPAPPSFPTPCPPEESISQGSWKSHPAGSGGGGGAWAGPLRHPRLPARPTPGSAAPCLPRTSPFLGAASGDPRCPGLGLGPGQLGRRGWRSEEVAVSLYIRNCMEITVSSSSTPRLPTSQGRWCST